MDVKKTVKEYSLITLGTFILIVGIYFFKFTNNFVTGGVSGISLVLSKLVPDISTGTFVSVLNVLLLIVGFMFVSNSFGIKTVYSTLLFSAGTMFLEWICPLSAPLTDEPLMELMFAVLLSALGSSILFNTGASSGGTDIMAMILKKYTEIDIGKALLICDGFIVLAAFFVFDIKTGLFSLMGLAVKSTAVDLLIENITLCKFFIIVTTKSEEICSYIMRYMHHGVTVSDAKGAFTEKDKKLVLVACKRYEALALKRKVKEIDEHAFTFITNTSEIIGKGFRH